MYIVNISHRQAVTSSDVGLAIKQLKFRTTII